MTVKQLIDKINTKLKINFEKPVIRFKEDGKNRYDMIAGRKYINTSMLLEMLRKEFRINCNIGEFKDGKKFIYILNNPNLPYFKIKYKQSNIPNEWGCFNQYTVTNIYIDDNKYFNYNI